MGKSGTSRLLSYSLEKTSTCVWQNGDRFPIQNIGSPYKTLLYFLKGARRAAADQTGTEAQGALREASSGFCGSEVCTYEGNEASCEESDMWLGRTRELLWLGCAVFAPSLTTG